ncbi:hypothetical protein M0802_000621 [Mischocyttarus mexicanus]|nr:hypothetical protein M0802_000621 [Mischocyttarus mexicanus]
MKLSVSAYRAQASAHKKILCNYQQQLSYGATNQASSSRTLSDPAAVLSGLKVMVSIISFYKMILMDIPIRVGRSIDQILNVDIFNERLTSNNKGFHRPKCVLGFKYPLIFRSKNEKKLGSNPGKFRSDSMSVLIPVASRLLVVVVVVVVMVVVLSVSALVRRIIDETLNAEDGKQNGVVHEAF